MRPDFVVVSAPVINDASRIFQILEPLLVQATITESAIERLDEGVLGRLTGLDEMQFHTAPSTPSVREYRPPDEPEFPNHDRAIRVTKCGRICIGKRKINLSTVFAGQTVGIREVADKIWLVSFLNYDLGFFDQDVGRVEPTTNPFLPEL